MLSISDALSLPFCGLAIASGRIVVSARVRESVHQKRERRGSGLVRERGTENHWGLVGASFRASAAC
eukprot:scaffold16407_cov127-Isochrysis_galbana.AAC.8